MSIKNNALDSAKALAKLKKKGSNFICDINYKNILSEQGALNTEFIGHSITDENINQLYVRSYFDFYGGYAEHSRNIVFRLLKSAPYRIKIDCLRTAIDLDPQAFQDINHLRYTPNFDIRKANFLTIAGPGYAQEKFINRNAKKNILWTMIESKECHPELVEWLNNVDEIWAPTTVDLERFKRAGVEVPIKRIPLGVDINEYSYRKKRPLDFVKMRNRFVFGVLGTWGYRKGMDDVLRAYFKAFGSNDPVGLLMCCRYGVRPFKLLTDKRRAIYDKRRWNIKKEIQDVLDEFKGQKLPYVEYFDVPLHENIMPNLMARFDCLVGFSRGESTWLPGLQAFALGIPVIQVENPWSGYADYMNDENSFLVKNYEVREADERFVQGTSEYYEGQEFVFGDIDELVEKMKDIYNKGAGERPAIARRDVEFWTWDASVAKVHKELTKE